MKKLILTVFVVFSLVTVGLASDYVGRIKNNKGQTVGTLRDSQHKVEYLNKQGFVEGWIDKKTGRTFDKRGFPTGSITPYSVGTK
jgi:hypothetical protein